MNISPALSTPYSRIAAPANAPQEAFDARAKGDDMALLDNFVRTSGTLLPNSAQMQSFAIGALPVVGLLKNGMESSLHSFFDNKEASRTSGAGALLNLGGTAGLIYGIASGSGLATLGSVVMLAGSGLISAR